MFPFRPGYWPGYLYPYGIRYPRAWVAVGIAATAWWVPPPWHSTIVYCGCDSQPYAYSYGDNITYNEGTVYYGDRPVASAEQYYQQANALASGGQQSANEDWLPLGVFGVARPSANTAERVVQLAVNKDGVIRGNFHDLLTDTVTPIVGAVDKKSQRVSMRLQGNDSVVVEAGLYNLTKDEVPVLVHFGPDRQETRTLVRLQQPTEQTQGQPQQPER